MLFPRQHNSSDSVSCGREGNNEVSIQGDNCIVISVLWNAKEESCLLLTKISSVNRRWVWRCLPSEDSSKATL